MWCKGPSCLSRLSNHIHEIDQGNQMDQLPAMRREMVPGTFSFFCNLRRGHYVGQSIG